MRKRCTWETVEEHKNMKLQKNEYEEVRILYGDMKSGTVRTLHGQNAYTDCKRAWEVCKLF